MIIIKIQWFGNSTFLLKTSLGKKIFIDPFNFFNTFKNDISVDVITLSKTISLAPVDSKCKVISSDESFNDSYIKVSGYSSYADNISGLKRGKNYIYIYEVDNLKICHLGYVGEMLNDEIIKVLRNCDVLFIPIGGNICIDGNLAHKLSDSLSPKYIIPMCYKVTNSDFYFQGPRDFICSSKNIFICKDSILDLSTLPKDKKNLTLLLNCK